MNNSGIIGPTGSSDEMKNHLDEMKKTESDSLPEYWKSLGFKVSHDWDRQYRWYECYKDNKLIFQVQVGVTVNKFIDALVETFTIPDKDLDFFIATDSTSDKEFFEICKLFPEFNERIKNENINLT